MPRHHSRVILSEIRLALIARRMQSKNPYTRQTRCPRRLFLSPAPDSENRPIARSGSVCLVIPSRLLSASESLA